MNQVHPLALDWMPIRFGPIRGRMNTVDQYLQFRLLHRDGLSIRQIARRLGHGRETVKKALKDGTPRGYTRSRPAVCPKLGRFIPIIEHILKEDESAPRKQRHTAARIFQRLRDEHQYAGKYDQLRRYVVATHQRSRTAGDQALEPMHFLSVLERKPAYLDHTKLFKDLTLPKAFMELRARLTSELGEHPGGRAVQDRGHERCGGRGEADVGEGGVVAELRPPERGVLSAAEQRERLVGRGAVAGVHATDGGGECLKHSRERSVIASDLASEAGAGGSARAGLLSGVRSMEDAGPDVRPRRAGG